MNLWITLLDCRRKLKMTQGEHAECLFKLLECRNNNCPFLRLMAFISTVGSKTWLWRISALHVWPWSLMSEPSTSDCLTCLSSTLTCGSGCRVSLGPASHAVISCRPKRPPDINEKRMWATAWEAFQMAEWRCKSNGWDMGSAAEPEDGARWKLHEIKFQGGGSFSESDWEQRRGTSGTSSRSCPFRHRGIWKAFLITARYFFIWLVIS